MCGFAKLECYGGGTERRIWIVLKQYGDVLSMAFFFNAHDGAALNAK